MSNTCHKSILRSRFGWHLQLIVTVLLAGANVTVVIAEYWNVLNPGTLVVNTSTAPSANLKLRADTFCNTKEVTDKPGPMFPVIVAVIAPAGISHLLFWLYNSKFLF